MLYEKGKVVAKKKYDGNEETGKKDAYILGFEKKNSMTLEQVRVTVETYNKVQIGQEIEVPVFPSTYVGSDSKPRYMLFESKIA